MSVVLGLATAIAWAFSNMFTLRLARLELDQTVVMAGILGVATAALVPVALIVDRGAGPWSVAALAWPFGAGVSAVVALLMLVRALSVGSLSVIAPIIALEGGIAAAMSIALGERPSGLEVVLMAVAIVGAVLVSLEPGRRTTAGAGAAVLSAIGFAGAFVGIGMSAFPALTTVAITRGVSFAIVLPLVLVFAGTRVPPRSSLGPFLGCGLLDALGYATFAFATAVGSIAVASVAATQWSTVAAIIGIVVLRERLRTPQYVGIAVTLTAVSALVAVG